MQIRIFGSQRQVWKESIRFTVLSLLSVSAIWGQTAARPWMNKTLPAGTRADLVLKQMSPDEKLALLHGNGMPGAPIW